MNSARLTFVLTLGTLLGACAFRTPDPSGRDATTPVLRIVSPSRGGAVASGTGAPGTVTLPGAGAGFVVTLQLVTRDDVQVKVREATLGPGSNGIQHEDKLGQPNPDFPGLTVTADTDLIMPDGRVIARGTNLAALFNIAGTDDTPGPGVTVWASWAVPESVPAGVASFTLTASAKDDAGRAAQDSVLVRVQPGPRAPGQDLTPAPTAVAGDGQDDEGGPVVSVSAPRAPTSVATGPAGTPPAGAGSLFFVQVTAVDRARAGIGVTEGVIFDPTRIANPTAGTVAGPNRFYPGLELTFDVPLIQPNGNRVAAGTNLAPLFDVAGSELGADGVVSTTAGWVVGGSLELPAGKTSVTITARVTDNAGRTTTAREVVGISATANGQNLTGNP
ncbi:hypothetical protein [Deinococcus pimensis]|uniref:hypothetical protein n=1 Tax=Deinococcus pimensis TaxID=309888 RepID=UPI0006944246|nr:hypothetical protein [Deinococcus pimensis]